MRTQRISRFQWSMLLHCAAVLLLPSREQVCVFCQLCVWAGWRYLYQSIYQSRRHGRRRWIYASGQSPARADPQKRLRRRDLPPETVLPRDRVRVRVQGVLKASGSGVGPALFVVL